MQVTIFSFLSAVLWSSVLIVATYCLRKINRFNRYFGVFAMVVLYLFSASRMFLSVEFMPTVIVESENVYPLIYNALHTQHPVGNTAGVSTLTILFAIWVSVSTVLLIRFLIAYFSATNHIVKYARPSGDREQRILSAISAKLKRPVKISISVSDDTDVPFGLGIWNKVILLPNHEYTDDELYYILLHETMHFVNRDILVKSMVSVFCIAFWWNPLAYLLKKDLEQTLEIKCDLSVVGVLRAEERASYLEAMVSTLKKLQNRRRIPYISTAFLQDSAGTYLKERFGAVINYNGDLVTRRQSSMIVSFFLGLLVLSYLFLPQPVFESPNSTNGVSIFEFDASNSYLKETGNGDYEMIIDGVSHGRADDDLVPMLIKDGFQLIEQE